RARDNSLIVFETPDGLYTIHPDGTGLARVPNTVPGDQNPVWSPNGTKIGFWHGPLSVSLAGNIFVIDADGGNRSQVTHDGRNSVPAWAPDGQTLVYDKYRRGHSELLTIGLDGSPAKPVLQLGDNYFPAWDPGDRIVYTGNEYYSHFEIWSMKPDG